MPTANRQTAKSTRAKSYLADKINTVPRPHDNDNPLWSGPSGIGPLGGVTQSMLGRFLDCRECSDMHPRALESLKATTRLVLEERGYVILENVEAELHALLVLTHFDRVFTVRRA